MSRTDTQFPARHMASMSRAVRSGREGEVARQLRGARQVWHRNVCAVLASIDLHARTKASAHPVAYKLLRKYGRECSARLRPYQVCYDNKVADRGGCTKNSILHAIDTGMELWSGYASSADGTSWHLWNVDAQGFVYDTTYGADSIFCRYLGVRIDPYYAYEVAVEQSRHDLTVAFLYWAYFGIIEAMWRERYGAQMVAANFAANLESAFERIAVLE